MCRVSAANRTRPRKQLCCICAAHTSSKRSTHICYIKSLTNYSETLNRSNAPFVANIEDLSNKCSMVSYPTKVDKCPYTCPTNKIDGHRFARVSNKHSALPMTRHGLAWSVSDKRVPCERSEQNTCSNKRSPASVRDNICQLLTNHYRVCRVSEANRIPYRTRQLPCQNHANCRGIHCVYIVHTRMNFAVIGKISSH